MNAVVAVIVLLSNQGYWFGGQAGTISVAWAAKDVRPAAVLVWNLMLGGVRIGGDRVSMPTTTQPSQVVITPPKVRVRTSLRWEYTVNDVVSGKQLTAGEVLIQVYPLHVLAGLSDVLAEKRIVVWDRAEELSTVLAAAKVVHKRIESPGDLQLRAADIVLAGPDCIDPSPFAQTALVGQAEGGASVLILAQSRLRVLAGYDLAWRRAPAKLDWRMEHPLLEGFRPEDLQSCVAGVRIEVRAIGLPADEPVLEIGYWPRETPGREPVPIDALLAVKAVGKGRIVLCQIPFGSWAGDPRSQLFLRNALSYLATRPEPTPPPSLRHVRPEPVPTSVPTITIPSGGRP